MFMKNLLIALLIIGTAFLLFYRIDVKSDVYMSEIEKLKMEKDSILDIVDKKNEVIISLHNQDQLLTQRLQEAKAKVKIVKVEVEKQIEVVKTYDSLDVVRYFNNRYPESSEIDTDTLVSIKLPVLIDATGDLIKYDIGKEEISSLEYVVSVQDSSIVLKDSIITEQAKIQSLLKQTVATQEREISNWDLQYKVLSLENKKLKTRSKVFKVTAAAVMAGLAGILIAK
jgi:hypothetical protein